MLVNICVDKSLKYYSSGVILYYGDNAHLSVELYDGRLKISFCIGNHPASHMYSYVTGTMLHSSFLCILHIMLMKAHYGPVMLVFLHVRSFQRPNQYEPNLEGWLPRTRGPISFNVVSNSLLFASFQALLILSLRPMDSILPSS